MKHLTIVIMFLSWSILIYVFLLLCPGQPSELDIRNAYILTTDNTLVKPGVPTRAVHLQHGIRNAYMLTTDNTSVKPSVPTRALHEQV